MSHFAFFLTAKRYMSDYFEQIRLFAFQILFGATVYRVTA